MHIKRQPPFVEEVCTNIVSYNQWVIQLCSQPIKAKFRHDDHRRMRFAPTLADSICSASCSPVQIRQQPCVDLDPVPQISEPQVLVLGMLVVVVIGDADAGHGHVKLGPRYRPCRSLRRRSAARSVDNRPCDRSRRLRPWRPAGRATVLVAIAPPLSQTDLDDLGVREAGLEVRLVAHDEPVLPGEVVLRAARACGSGVSPGARRKSKEASAWVAMAFAAAGPSSPTWIARTFKVGSR